MLALVILLIEIKGEYKEKRKLLLATILGGGAEILSRTIYNNQSINSSFKEGGKRNEYWGGKKE